MTRSRKQSFAGAALLCLVVAGVALGCRHRTPRERDLLNLDAALPAALPTEPLGWKVINSSIDRKHHTMATLFGNDIAAASARLATGSVTYPAGSVLSLVTWQQREDEHWFGGRIPQRFLSMELVTVTVGVGKPAGTYECYGPTGEQVSDSTASEDAMRTDAILRRPPSFMP